MAAHQVLEDDLVHRHRAGHHACPDIRDAGHLEEPLQGAVLAERPVQRQEGDVDRLRQRAQDRARRELGAVIGDRHRQIGMAAQHAGLLRRRRRAEELGQRLLSEEGRRAGGQMPATLAVDEHEIWLEPLAVDRTQDGVRRADADLVLG